VRFVFLVKGAEGADR